MSRVTTQFRPMLRIAIPVAVAAALITTALINVFVVRNFQEKAAIDDGVLWMSDGGRDYAPWNGRHRKAIGLEEICGYFHLGHNASIADNPIAAAGSPTSATLKPGGSLEVAYMFGVTAVPPGFGAVRDIVSDSGGVRLTDADGNEVFAACDVSFITGSGARPGHP